MAWGVLAAVAFVSAAYARIRLCLPFFARHPPLHLAGMRNVGTVIRLFRLHRTLKFGTASRQIVRDRRGAIAVEFGLVCLPFTALVLFMIALGYRLYVQAALDYVAGQAGRMLAVDTTQSQSKSVQNFQTLTLCPLLSPFLSCNNVTVTLMAVTDYSNATYTNTGPPRFSPGGSNSLMLLRLSYTLPNLGWPSPTGSAAMTFLGATVNSYYPYQNEY